MACKLNFISSIFLIISSWLLIQTAANFTISLNDSKIYSLCTDAPMLTNTNFTDNLNDVLTNLINKAPQDYGYWFTFSSSAGNYLDWAFGLALCRGDVPMDNCMACLSNAKGNITTDCKESRRAIIWYDFCFLKFADFNFLGYNDTVNLFHTKSDEKARHPRKFYRNAKHLLELLSNKTSYIEGMFAYDHVPFRNLTIYAMAQCSRDISSCGCKNCLQFAIDHLQDFSDNSTAIPLSGSSYTGSCYVKYDVKDFYLRMKNNT